MTSASDVPTRSSSPSTSGRGRPGIYQPILIGADELEEDGEEGSAHELALRTFYEQEDEYDALHRRWYRTSKEVRERMEKEGLVWRKGRWSVQEIRLLKRNVKAFMRECGIKDIASFISDYGEV